MDVEVSIDDKMEEYDLVTTQGAGLFLEELQPYRDTHSPVKFTVEYTNPDFPKGVKLTMDLHFYHLVTLAVLEKVSQPQEGSTPSETGATVEDLGLALKHLKEARLIETCSTAESPYLFQLTESGKKATYTAYLEDLRPARFN